MTHFFHNIKYFATFLAILLTSMGSRGQLTIDEKVDSVLNLMSLSEKVGQMAQAERGELENINDIATFGLGSLLSGGGSAPSPNNLPSWVSMYDNFQSIALQSNRKIPIIYGIDAVHGHNNVYGAVIFPHNIGMGCTWNAELVQSASEVVAREVAATGIDWTFAPCIAVPRNERWGRTYEGFGETPEIQKIMAAASVSGLQGNDPSDSETILSCAKHYVGDGGTADGIDQGNTIALESSLREIHMAGYIDAIEAGDWMKYQVKVAESGLYSLSCRISGYEPGTLQFAFNDSIQAFVGYTATNGWQNWQDFTTEVYLNAGNYIMEVVAQYHAFNINYYHF